MLLSPLKSPKVIPNGFSPASYSTTASKTVPETLEGKIFDSVGKSVELHVAIVNVPELTRNNKITVLKLRLKNKLQRKGIQVTDVEKQIPTPGKFKLKRKPFTGRPGY